MFATKQVDPGSPTYSLDFLRKHPEISIESSPWHVHEQLRMTPIDSCDRRRFLHSLSRTALVLPFADVLGLAQQSSSRTYGTKL